MSLKKLIFILKKRKSLLEDKCCGILIAYGSIYAYQYHIYLYSKYPIIFSEFSQYGRGALSATLNSKKLNLFKKGEYQGILHILMLDPSKILSVKCDLIPRWNVFQKVLNHEKQKYKFKSAAL